MSDPFAELDDLETHQEQSVGAGEEDRRHAKNVNDLEWFKGDNKAFYRVSFVKFDTLVMGGATRALAKAKADGKPAPGKDQLIELSKQLLAKRAGEYEKSVDQLLDYEKLDLSEARFKKVVAHYKQDFGFVVSRLGKDGPDADETWKTLGDPKNYFLTVVMIYPTDRQGNLDKELLTKRWTVMPWRMSSKVYGQILDQAGSLRNNGLSLADQDLKIQCTNADYQNFDKMEAAGKAIWRQNPKFRDMVLARAYPLYEKLKPFRELSTADLRIKLGVSSGGSQGTDVSPDDMDDLIGNV